MAQLPSYINKKDAIVRKIHEALEQQRAAEPDRGLRLSELGDCERLLWAKQNRGEKVPVPGPEILAIFDTGKAFEELVVRWLELADIPVFDRQETLSMWPTDDVEIQGHADGFVEVGGEVMVLEVKSAKAKQFDECKRLGYAKWQPKYAGQIQSYMGTAHVKAALCVVVCKDTSELYIEKIRFDPDMYLALRRKAFRVLAVEAAPERPYANQYAAPCRWCPLAEQCWSAAWDVQFDKAEYQSELRTLSAEYRALKENS